MGKQRKGGTQKGLQQLFSTPYEQEISCVKPGRKGCLLLAVIPPASASDALALGAQLSPSPDLSLETPAELMLLFGPYQWYRGDASCAGLNKRSCAGSPAYNNACLHGS